MTENTTSRPESDWTIPDSVRTPVSTPLLPEIWLSRSTPWNRRAKVPRPGVAMLVRYGIRRSSSVAKLSTQAVSVLGRTRLACDRPDPSLMIVEIAASAPSRSSIAIRITLAPLAQVPCSRVTWWPIRLSSASA